MVSVYNFFRDLTPFSKILNIIGFSCFVLLLSVNIKQLIASK